MTTLFLCGLLLPPGRLVPLCHFEALDFIVIVSRRRSYHAAQQELAPRPVGHRTGPLQ